jgi:hypothetical protein
MAGTSETRKVVEFYTIELAQLADGTFGISMIATSVDDEEPQLLSQELVNGRATSIDEALTVIRESVVGTKP